MKSLAPFSVATERRLLMIIGIVLILFGLAKLLSAGGTESILNVRNPLLPITNRLVLILVGGLEIGLGSISVSSANTRLSAGLVAWFSTAVVIYRVGLYAINYTRPCKCLGALTDAIGISETTADNIAKVVLFFLVITSYSVFLRKLFSDVPVRGN